MVIAKVTLTPETGFPPPSVTVTAKGLASAELTLPLWLFPEVSAIVVAGPAVALAVNVTGLPVKPVELAVTV